MNDPFDFTLRVGGALVLLYCLLMIGRAMAARIAGDKAPLVLGMSLVTITVPALPRLRGEVINEESNETENSETGENTENSTVPTVSEYMAVSSVRAGGVIEHTMVKRMTPEERTELIMLREDSVGLLSLCLDYFRATGKQDLGVIPRYNHLHVGATQRENIVKALEYSGLVSVFKNNKTVVIQEHNGTPIVTCAELMRLLKNGQKRVYPDGFNERGKMLADSAVNSLEATSTHGY